MNKINKLFLSVGAMKAGTTWLYEHLKNHDDIHFSPEKEIHYFANKSGIESQLTHKNRALKLKKKLEEYHLGNVKFIANIAHDIEWYAKYAKEKDISNNWYISLFDGKPESAYAADFSNLYCQMDQNGWNLVRESTSSVKVIYILRDPLQRVWSHFKFHQKWLGHEDIVKNMSFQEYKEVLSQPWFWSNAEYVKNIKNLKENLNKDELKVMFFEDIHANPQNALNEITTFLDIKRRTIPIQKASSKINSTKDFEFPNEWREYTITLLQDTYRELNSMNLSNAAWSKL